MKRSLAVTTMDTERKRTSPMQILTMLEFMEKHGDILKVPNGVDARLKNINLWKELCRKLNAQEDNLNRKSLQKWKKTWADLKAKAKKKVNNGDSSTNFSSTHERVLQIMGYSILNEDAEDHNMTSRERGDDEDSISSVANGNDVFDEEIEISDSDAEHRENLIDGKSPDPVEEYVDCDVPLRKRRRKDTEEDSMPYNLPGFLKVELKRLKLEEDREKMLHERELERDRLFHKREMERLRVEDSRNKILKHLAEIVQIAVENISLMNQKLNGTQSKLESN